jgi:hypothetical protein
MIIIIGREQLTTAPMCKYLPWAVGVVRRFTERCASKDITILFGEETTATKH